MGQDWRLSKMDKGLRGTRRPVKTGAQTLTREDSGALCLFNTEAGYTFTLPPAEQGLWFEFAVHTTITSVAAKVLCATGDFIVGGFEQSTDSTYTTAVHAANGSTHVSWNGNGTTTGGLINDRFTVTAISDSQWYIEGSGRATGTEATPFGTS